MIVRLTTGFALGTPLAVTLLIFVPGTLGQPGTALEMWLPIYGLGSFFALGYLATSPEP
jgi:hypothetical protein